MDATTNGLLIASIATLAGNIVMKVFEERKRAQDREQDRKDREQAAKLTAEHRVMMSEKLDANTAVSMVAAEKADVAAQKADIAAGKAEVLQASAEQIVRQTNGMQENLMKLASDAGFRKGQDEEKSRHPGT